MNPLVQTGSVLFSIVHDLCGTAFMYLSLLNTIQKPSKVLLLPFCLIPNVLGRFLFFCVTSCLRALLFSQTLHSLLGPLIYYSHNLEVRIARSFSC